MRRLRIVSGWILAWGSWPLSWLILSGSQRARLLLECDGTILVVKSWITSDRQQRWSLPGGGKKSRESMLQAVIRETREETGITITPDSLRSLGVQSQSSKGIHFQCHYFLGQVKHRPPIHLNFELIEASWQKMSDLNAENADDDVVTALTLVHQR